MSSVPTLGELASYFEEHPLAASLELGTVLACVVLFVATFAALSGGPPTGTGGVWLAVVVLGATVVLFWTVIVPLYERAR